MNVDKKEIDNFDIYAHEWWNKKGPYKLIHNLLFKYFIFFFF